MLLKYTITNPIINDLTSIAAAKEIIDHAFVLPQWEIKLRQEAILLSAHHSTHIEGNALTLEQVSQLAQGREVFANRKDKIEVINYIKALSSIERYSKSSLDHKLILKIHKDIVRGTLKDKKSEGKYRKQSVVVGRIEYNQLVVTYRPPHYDEVPALVKKFLEWLNSETIHLNPILLSGIAHYELVRIHPFVDGNGRTARALATLLLFKSGFDIKRFFTLDDYYDSKRENYYKALKTVDPKKLNITKWLEYYVRGVKLSVERVKEKVLELSREKKAASMHGQVYLSPKQMKILNLLEKNERLRAHELAEKLKVSRQAIHKDLQKLMQLDLVKKSGAGPQLHYSKS